MSTIPQSISQRGNFKNFDNDGVANLSQNHQSGWAFPTKQVLGILGTVVTAVVLLAGVYVIFHQLV
ncbi:MAG TPA: hypothetical protein VFA74_10740 [Terriglobales bacterium]|nr:hypothetical protein [Terriglobales bacterium]